MAIVVPTFVAQQLRMMVMNLADYDGDLRIGKRTLAIVLGRARAVRVFAAGQVVGVLGPQIWGNRVKGAE